MEYLLIVQLWTSIWDPTAYLQGNWQSCTEDGAYAERIYDRVENGIPKWSFHMGPFNDFALFKAGEEPDEDNHDASTNLLTDHHVGSRKTWTVPFLRLKVSVTQAGGSRDDCASWYVRIEALRRKK